MLVFSMPPEAWLIRQEENAGPMLTWWFGTWALRAVFLFLFGSPPSAKRPINYSSTPLPVQFCLLGTALTTIHLYSSFPSWMEGDLLDALQLIGGERGATDGPSNA